MVIHACLDRNNGGDYADFLVLDGVGGTPEKVPVQQWKAQNREPSLDNHNQPIQQVQQVEVRNVTVRDQHFMAGDYEVDRVPHGTLKSKKMIGKHKGPKLPLQQFSFNLVRDKRI